MDVEKYKKNRTKDELEENDQDNLPKIRVDEINDDDLGQHSETSETYTELLANIDNTKNLEVNTGDIDMDEKPSKSGGSEIWKFPDFKNEFCPHFSSNFNLRLILHFESKLSDSKANFKRISRESRGDLETRGRLRLRVSFFRKLVIKGLPFLFIVADLCVWGSIWRPLGGKDPYAVSWSTRDRLRVGYGFLVRLSMFRHLFIDLLEYGGLVSSMLNFYNSP
ncbi:hypothetical protein H5410_051880 [Solanum commersonii]|uniref:Uncharacterized protein n=1 Tax=Solanum commersonii TaxID=4109 RepID=A0A9J5X1D5_SOLCO|nr:hypothetical protein H5410_051880 [Solanum commersonii]